MDGLREIAFGKKGHSREIERRLRQRRNSAAEMFKPSPDTSGVIGQVFRMLKAR